MIRADIGSISVSANTQGCNIGIVSEVKKLYRDTPNMHIFIFLIWGELSLYSQLD